MANKIKFDLDINNIHGSLDFALNLIKNSDLLSRLSKPRIILEIESD